jgi:hypothetical protein
MQSEQDSELENALVLYGVNSPTLRLDSAED